MRTIPSVVIDAPAWLPASVHWDLPLATDGERMALAIELSRQNVLRGTGGPFGAIVVERKSGLVVGAGVNSVVRLNNSALHAEVTALMFAQAQVGNFSLGAAGLPAHELVSSCEPCAMCLGATLWSGVTRLVFGASRGDASALEFDEGPVFPESYAYLESRGVEVVRGVMRKEAAAVLELYRRQGGPIYNG
jgi:tRNA(Arg) A34 adenosine deaminase TadA